jgi:hypothetical protein
MGSIHGILGWGFAHPVSMPRALYRRNTAGVFDVAMTKRPAHVITRCIDAEHLALGLHDSDSPSMNFLPMSAYIR